VNNSITIDQASIFISHVSQHDYLQDPKHLTSHQTGSLLVYFIKELYEYMKRLIKVDMKSLHEYRRLSEELKHFKNIKIK
jgi:hypothetical protein